jgi:hypothetical protein
MPRGGLEPTIPASKRAKTVHALHHSATVTVQPIATQYADSTILPQLNVIIKVDYKYL